MRALPTNGDVCAYGHVAHRKQRRCRDPRSSSLYRSLPLAFSWARAMGHVAYPSRDQSAQAFPVFKFTLPRKSKRARNGEGLGLRLGFIHSTTQLCKQWMCRFEKVSLFEVYTYQQVCCTWKGDRYTHSGPSLYVHIEKGKECITNTYLSLSKLSDA